MDNRKTLIRFFTIADFEEEELWLREMHAKGWKLVKCVPPCFFTFESCEPEDVVYRLDYKNRTETKDYYALFSDYGWEYICRCAGWLYFRKPASEADSELDRELFSDAESRIDMLSFIMRTRMLPLATIFFAVIPNFKLSVGLGSYALFIIYLVMMGVYIWILTHCGLKLRRLKGKYGGNR